MSEEVKAEEDVRPAPLWKVEIRAYCGLITLQHSAKGWEISGECESYEALPCLFEAARIVAGGDPRELRRKVT